MEIGISAVLGFEGSVHCVYDEGYHSGVGGVGGSVCVQLSFDDMKGQHQSHLCIRICIIISISSSKSISSNPGSKKGFRTRAIIDTLISFISIFEQTDNSIDILIYIQISFLIQFEVQQSFIRQRQ